MKPRKIMVVEDAHSLRAIIVSDLIRRGFDVFLSENLQGARAGLRRFKPDLVVLDLSLPDGDGIELIDECQKDSVLCLVLTSMAQKEEMFSCLARGAQEYIVKPIDESELFLRVRNLVASRPAVLKASEISLVEIGGIKIDLMGRQLVSNDLNTSSRLTEYEFRLLRLLSEALEGGRTREDLNRLVLGHKAISESRALDMLVSKLRSKIRKIGSSVTIISLRGQGYMLHRSLLDDYFGR